MDGRVGLRLLWRDWKGGELTLLLGALVLAVTTVAGIAIFVDRLQRALVLESNAFLGADRVIEASEPIPAAWRERARRMGLETARTLTFSSMAFVDERSQLVAVKAVSPGYPLRGTLKTAEEAFVAGGPTREIPAPGTAWLDGRLLPALGVDIGEQVAVGRSTLRVTQVLTYEPDRGGTFVDVSPRLMMNLADVEATGVVQPGSRLRYALLLSGEPGRLEAFRESLAGEFDGRYDWDDVADSSRSIGSALDRAERFLLLGGLLAVILSGLAVALAARRYAERQHDPVAVLKTFGVTPNQIQYLYLGNLLVLGVLATLVGLVLGWFGQLLVLRVLGELVPVSLPAPGLRPYAIASVTGVVCLLAFALPPLVRLRGVSPLRVIRRDFAADDPSVLAAYGAGFAGVVVLLVWYAGSPALAAWLLLGTFGSVAVLLGLAGLLLRTGRVVGMQAGSGWRIALAGLQRRGRENRVQILVFGLAIMLLLILFLIRTALLDEWRSQLPPDAPNHFLLNIAPYEVEPLRTMLEEEGATSQPFYPMTRGRVVAVNGDPLATASVPQPTAAAADEAGAGEEDAEQLDRRLARERNLSWAEALPAANRLVAGRWWDEEPERALVSLEDEYARDAGLEVGDVLTFSVADRRFEATVANLRQVDWDSMRPNFFVLLSPGALEGFPATYLTSFRIEADRKAFLNDLLARFPTISVIEIDRVVEQVQQIIDRVTVAVELVLMLVVAAGALVLVASIQSSMDERIREFGLLRALGAGRRRILGALVIEFTALGLFAGVLAAVGAEASVWLLQEQVFELEARLHPAIWLAGPLLGVVLIGVIGTWATRRVVAVPPAVVLRHSL